MKITNNSKILIAIVATLLLSIILIIFTPIKKYVYLCDKKTKNYIINLEDQIDSLNKQLYYNQVFNQNLHKLFSDEDTTHSNEEISYYKSSQEAFDNIFEENEFIEDIQYNQNTSEILPDRKNSYADSIFRKKFETTTNYKYYMNSNKDNIIKNTYFYPPISGIITSNYNLGQQHIGTDITPVGSYTVKAASDGTVIFSDWTTDTGHVIIISHSNNIITAYKHNAILLKKQGDFVNAGEAIAICGNSGELTTGVHLHFELWIDSHPVDPTEFIKF
ncbi:MAG: peptidoglycan DD-metalloendopeptidase family protein [Bacteroidales bacterium]